MLLCSLSTCTCTRTLEEVKDGRVRGREREGGREVCNIIHCSL